MRKEVIRILSVHGPNLILKIEALGIIKGFCIGRFGARLYSILCDLHTSRHSVDFIVSTNLFY